MKKDELIDAVSAETGHSKTTVRQVFDATDEVVRRAIEQGEPVRLFGLGKLSVIRRPSRVAQNFGRGAVLIDEFNKVVFKPSQGLAASGYAAPV